MGVDEGHADNHDILRVRYVYHQDTKSNFLQQGTLTRNVTERERRMGGGGGEGTQGYAECKRGNLEGSH